MTTAESNSPLRGSLPSKWLLWLSFAASLLSVFALTVIVTAWAVREAVTEQDATLSEQQRRIVRGIATLPGRFRSAVRELSWRMGGDPETLLVDRRTTERPHWVRRFPAPEDSGYLLFSGLDRDTKQSAVHLIRISDGARVASWNPDWQAIYARCTSKRFHSVGSTQNARAMHPLLLADGDIIFNTAMALVRLGPFSGEPVWLMDEVAHHSIELDSTGDAVWVPSTSYEGLTDNPWLRARIRDDALARISTDGKLLERRSFGQVLIENDRLAFLLGSALEDPIHLNQIAVAPGDSRYWRRGDLLISARHLSSVFLFRPSSGKILWGRTGPWMNQHSAAFVDEHRISVFSNNVMSRAPREHAFLSPGDTNRVFVYDFDTGESTEPFRALIAEARPVTVTEGRARLLPDGGLFVEETNFGRVLRFTRDRLLWSLVNDYDEDSIGILGWCRYLTAEEARGPLQALEARRSRESSSGP